MVGVREDGGMDHTYAIDLTWQGNRGTGTSGYRDYGRDVLVRAPGKPDLAGSADPTFRGDDQANGGNLTGAMAGAPHAGVAGRVRPGRRRPWARPPARLRRRVGRPVSRSVPCALQPMHRGCVPRVDLTSNEALHRIALRFGHVQAALGAAPEDVVGGAGEFLLPQIADLSLGQASSEVPAEIAR